MQSAESKLKSKMFLSNSVEMMKNLPRFRHPCTGFGYLDGCKHWRKKRLKTVRVPHTYEDEILFDVAILILCTIQPFFTRKCAMTFWQYIFEYRISRECIFSTHFLKAIIIYSMIVFHKILPLSTVSIQKLFIIKISKEPHKGLSK